MKEFAKKSDLEDADILWMRYRENKTKENRDKLITHYLSFVKAIAMRILERLPRNVLEFNDLVNAGIFGLIDAIERYDPTKGVKFSAYSYTKIQGSILDELRKLDCISYLGRNLAQKVESGYYELYKNLGREPGVEEIAKYLKIDVSEVKEGLSLISRINMAGKNSFYVKDAKTGNCVQLTEFLEDKSVDSQKSFLCESLKKYVKTTFSTFEQLVFTLYFESNLNLTQIAKMFDYSHGRISEIFNHMLLKLRNHLRLLLEEHKR